MQSNTLVDAEGRSMKFERTAGQTHDSQPAPGMLEDMQEGAILLADKAFDNDAIRKSAEDRKGMVKHPGQIQPQNIFCVLQMALPLQA